ncbi:MAG: WecB/TagA/CpsF family glycosyltransferase [Magnetococcus sp. DMHC-6]
MLPKISDPVLLFDIPLYLWTMEETLEQIARRIDAGIFTQHSVVNVAKLVKMRTDPQLREAVISCDIINIDGTGVVWGARFLGLPVPERVAGIDLFYALLGMAQGRGDGVFLLGAKESVVNKAVENIRLAYPKLHICGWHHGYFWDHEEAIVDKIQASGAKLLFVAITSPKKEIFIQRWQQRLQVPFVMGVGGTFDVVAGFTKRAPLWMQQAGLEWFYRLIQEPRRMWRRYLYTNMVFAWLLLREKWRGKFDL